MTKTLRGGMPYGVPQYPEKAQPNSPKAGVPGYEPIRITKESVTNTLQKVRDKLWEKRRDLLLNIADVLEYNADLVTPLLDMVEASIQKENPEAFKKWKDFAGPSIASTIQAIRDNFTEDSRDPERRQELREQTNGNPYGCVKRCLKQEPFVITSMKKLGLWGSSMTADELERHIRTLGKNLASKYAAPYLTPERRKTLLQGLNPEDYMPHTGKYMSKEELLALGDRFPEIVIRYSNSSLTTAEIMSLARKGGAWITLTLPEIASRLTATNLLELINLPNMASLTGSVINREHPHILIKLETIRGKLDPLLAEKLNQEIAAAI